MSDEKIEKISKITESVEELKGATKPQDLQPIDRERFEKVLHKETTQVDSPKETVKPSLMDEVRSLGQQTHLSPKVSHVELLAQLDTARKRLDEVKQQLSIADLEIKSSPELLMRKKLLHIDESLKAALSKVSPEEGVLNKITDASLPSTSPISRFLGLLTSGQERLYSLSHAIQQVAEQKELSPAALLTIQVKVNVVQQQIELFTSLLNKALESTKTIMNVQV